MGSAQSHSSCKARGSIPHPAINPALKISRVSGVNLMAGVLCSLHRPDTGLGRADRELGLGRMAALPRSYTQGNEKAERERAPEKGAAPDGGYEADEERDHGVFPVR